MEGTLAQVIMFAGNFAPRNWAYCEGQLIAISQNSALFSLIGTIYGGDGRTTFALPDLRGRVPVGTGRGPGLSPYQLGQRGGAESIILNTLEIPAHNHMVQLVETSPAVGGITVGSTGRGSTQSNSPANNYISEIANGFRSDAGTGTMKGVAITGPQYTANVGNTGGNQPHENRQPYLAMNYVICMQGIFPSRN